MSSLEAYLCLGGIEVANIERVTAYSRGLINGCDCAALDEVYDSPSTDPAPWYDPAHPVSAGFLGFLPKAVNLSVPTLRNTNEVLDEGSVLGRERRPGRVVEVVGWMIADDQESMWWGERWLNKVLRGQGCQGGCGGDELMMLPYCRDTGDEILDYLDIYIDEFIDTFGVPDGSHISFDTDFRSLFGAALVDGPRWAPVSSDDDYVIQTAQFQVASRLPWLYAQPVSVADGWVAAHSTDCTTVTTDEWTDGEALSVTITATGAGVNAPGLDFIMSYTLDGTCPEDRIYPSVAVHIPVLEPEAGLTIDGASQQVIYHDPTSHRDEPGFDRITWTDQFCWPTIPACTTMCVCVVNDSDHPVTVSIDRRKREL